MDLEAQLATELALSLCRNDYVIVAQIGPDVMSEKIQFSFTRDLPSSVLVSPFQINPP